jgi:hypothetical protein
MSRNGLLPADDQTQMQIDEVGVTAEDPSGEL